MIDFTQNGWKPGLPPGDDGDNEAHQMAYQLGSIFKLHDAHPRMAARLWPFLESRNHSIEYNDLDDVLSFVLLDCMDLAYERLSEIQRRLPFSLAWLFGWSSDENSTRGLAAALAARGPHRLVAYGCRCSCHNREAIDLHGRLLSRSDNPRDSAPVCHTRSYPDFRHADVPMEFKILAEGPSGRILTRRLATPSQREAVAPAGVMLH